MAIFDLAMFDEIRRMDKRQMVYQVIFMLI